MVKGDLIDGSAVVYFMEGNELINGLWFESGDLMAEISGEMQPFNCGLSLVSHSGGISYINRMGEEVISGEFRAANNFKENRTWVIIGEKTILIDTEGSHIKEFDKYPSIGPFNNGLAKISEFKDRSERMVSGYIDLNGNYVIPKIEEVTIKTPLDILDSEDDYYSEGLIRLSQNGHYGFIDKEINTIIPFMYNYASRFVCSLSAARIGNLSGYIDKKNKIVFPFEFENASQFSPLGFAPAKLKGKWGAIDLKGNTVIPFEYENLKLIEDNLLLFRLNGKFGIMDNQMNLIIKPQYDMILNYSEGICKFLLDSCTGVVDRSGNQIIEYLIRTF